MKRARPRLQLGLVAVTTLLVGASFLGAAHLLDQTLHHLPTFLALPLLARAAYRSWLGDEAFLATILFLWIHTLGARAWDAQKNTSLASSARSWRRPHSPPCARAGGGGTRDVPTPPGDGTS